MANNEHQLSPVHSQTYSNAETAVQSVPLHHDSLGLNSFVIADSSQPRLDSSHPSGLHPYQNQNQNQNQNQPSAVPITQYADYNLHYQPNPRELVHGYESPIDTRTGSPHDLKATYITQINSSFSENSGERVAIASARSHRPSITSLGRVGHLNRHGSIDESDGTSPTSSRGYGVRGSDDSIPYINGIATRHGNGGSGRSKDDKTKPPPWSELKTKAGKERKRLPLACIACRRKKIRCSGEKPACKHCLRSRIPCVYKVTTRKPAPRTDYMGMLDKRLKKMEDRVIKIIPKGDFGKLQSIGRANVKPPTSNQATRSGGAKKRAAEEAFGSELKDWAHAGSNAAASLPHQLPKAKDKVENRTLSEGAEELPPKEIQEHLSEVFFDCLYGQSYHLLHKPSFMRRLKQGKVPPVLILAVCAVSARFSTHPQVNTEPAFLRGESWAKPCRDIVLRRYDEPNITILTVLLILGLHEFGTCQGGRSWMLGGMAMRMAYALQLHKELDHDPLGRKQGKSSELSFTDREIRRRTMWATFLMDRFNSSGTERPTMLIEENIQVQLPIAEKNFQMEIPGPTESLGGSIPNPISPDTGQISDPKKNMGVAAYLIRVIALFGRVNDYINLGGVQTDPHPLWHAGSRYMELKQQVERFKESWPESLRYGKGNLQTHAIEKLANQFLFFHISYSQVVMFLNRFAISMALGGRIPQDTPKDFVHKTAQISFDAASQISNLLNDASDYLIAAPFAGYCAFASSTVHVWGIFSKNPQLEASSKRNLESNVKYLNKMKKHWGMFHYMIESLKEIYRQQHDQALKPNNPNDSTKPDASIFQYGDWFDKYPHGVSGADYDDPAVKVKKESGDDAALGQKSDLQSVEEFFTSKPSLSPQRPEPPKKATKRHGRDSLHLIHQPQMHHGVKNEHQVPHPQIQPQQPRAMLNMSQHPQQQQQPMDLTPYSQDIYTPSHPTFPPNAFAPNNMMHPSQQGFMPELDRQIVYGAYAGNNPTANASSATLNNLVSGNPNSMWDQSMAFSHAYPASQAYSGLDSGAWFMPFNLNPPNVGVDGEFPGLGYPMDVVGNDGERDAMNGSGNSQ